MASRGLLRNGDYLKLLSGQTISSLGSAMSSFVCTLLAMSITGSPAQAGLVGAARRYLGLDVLAKARLTTITDTDTTTEEVTPDTNLKALSA